MGDGERRRVRQPRRQRDHEGDRRSRGRANAGNVIGRRAEPTSHRFVADSGVGLVVHDWGGGAGRPVLLAHATGFHGRVWAPIASRLVATGSRVWSFDFRGHGDSDAPPADADHYSWRRFADDALAVATHLGLAGDPDLVAAGHSKGAVALLLGKEKRPGTFGRVCAFEPVIFP